LHHFELAFAGKHNPAHLFSSRLTFRFSRC
jgi:hypothetical protein